MLGFRSDTRHRYQTSGLAVMTEVGDVIGGVTVVTEKGRTGEGDEGDVGPVYRAVGCEPTHFLDIVCGCPVLALDLSMPETFNRQSKLPAAHATRTTSRQTHAHVCLNAAAWSERRRMVWSDRSKDGFPSLSGVKTLYESMKQSVEKNGDKPALGWRPMTDGKAGAYEWLTYKQADGEAAAAYRSTCP